MRITNIAPRRAALAVGVLAVSGAVAACGSSTSSTTTSRSGASASAPSTTPGSGSGFNRSTFIACLKQHGVTLPSRPSGSSTGGPPTGSGGPPAGGGFFGGGGGGTGGRGGFFRSNSKFAAAFRDCGGANFRRGAGRFRLSHTLITRYVTCVRQHGYKLPNPNFSGHGSVFPSNIRTNPKFQAASRACQSILVPARPASSTSTTAAS